MGKSKKKEKIGELDYIDVYKKIRKTWKINPVERIVKSKKKYKRSKEKRKWQQETDAYE
jgi:hypothetical protein